MDDALALVIVFASTCKVVVVLILVVMDDALAPR